MTKKTISTLPTHDLEVWTKDYLINEVLSLPIVTILNPSIVTNLLDYSKGHSIKSLVQELSVEKIHPNKLKYQDLSKLPHSKYNIKTGKNKSSGVEQTPEEA